MSWVERIYSPGIGEAKLSLGRISLGLLQKSVKFVQAPESPMKSWPQIKNQGHPTPFFSKITDRRSKYCLEISSFKALERV